MPMLKLQGDYTTLISTFENFILLVYKMIDDYSLLLCPLLKDKISELHKCPIPRP